MIVNPRKSLQTAISQDGYSSEHSIKVADRNRKVWHQQKIRCCTAIVVCALMDNHVQVVQKQHQALLPFSPLFLYYTARKRKALERYNVDLSFVDIFDAIKESGICPNDYWPFVPRKFREAPPANAYEVAKPFRGISFRKVAQDLAILKNTLAHGRYIAFGLRLFLDNHWDFFSGASVETGLVTMPNNYSNPYSNHALLLVAYDAGEKRFVFRNSFGVDWGDKGYGYIPESYLLHPQGAFDFYTIVAETLRGSKES